MLVILQNRRGLIQERARRRGRGGSRTVSGAWQFQAPDMTSKTVRYGSLACNSLFLPPRKTVTVIASPDFSLPRRSRITE